MQGLSSTNYRWQDEFGGSFAGRTVLVTGATGFLGSHLCGALSELGAVVHGWSRGTRSIAGETYRRWTVDVTDHDAVHIAIAAIRPEIVFHFAGLATAREDRGLVLPTLKHNLMGTLHLLLALTETRCHRVALPCSAEEARAPHCHAPPASPYGAAKTAATVYGRLFHRAYGVPVVLLRPFLAYGPGQEASKLIPHATASLLRQEAPELSSGTRVCDFVYVKDVVRAFLLAAVKPDAVGETIDVGSGVGTPIREAVELLVALSGSRIQPAFGALPDRIEDSMGSADTTSAKQFLGWEPLWSLEAGLSETLAGYARRASMPQATG
jgi:UDP-glucose 4-epimerase